MSDLIYKGDTINLGFEVRYPFPIKVVELEIQKGDKRAPSECFVKENVVQALIKGEEIGEHTAWFRVVFNDNAVRSFPMEYIVKAKPGLNKSYKPKSVETSKFIIKQLDNSKWGIFVND